MTITNITQRSTADLVDRLVLAATRIEHLRAGMNTSNADARLADIARCERDVKDIRAELIKRAPTVPDHGQRPEAMRTMATAGLLLRISELESRTMSDAEHTELLQLHDELDARRAR